jgi:enoyl-CoA hydratase/carnithine racemase
MSQPSEGRIVREIDGAVGRITIDNPTKANTLDLGMVRALRGAWQWAESSDEVQSVVLTATGDRHFCGGINMSLAASTATDKSKLEVDESPRSFTSRDFGFTKPVVLALNGAVLAGGLGLFTGADIVVASRTATLLDPHVRLGQITGFTGIRFGRLLPPGEAIKSLLGGIELNAERAYELGLISELYDTADEARTAAGVLATRIAQHSPTAVRANLSLLHKLAWGANDDPLVEEAMAAQEAHFAHPDSAEGFLAFAERRPGRWKPFEPKGDSS